ncbi:MAG TPA: PQQ-dependent sugar dehydrogenase, partial [Methanomassiliicoccaceae archaeon]|nr:PQQ-dependent sugar dehydrogenase [Methanomassiliicoccaceae archaeon]
MRKATWAPIAAIILVGAAVAYVLISTQPQGSAPPIEDELRLEPIAEGLVHPVAAAIAPGIDDRVFIVDQIGTVHMLMDDGTLVDEPFIDLRDDIVELNPIYDERGLLSIAFHPDYPSDRRVYAFYTSPPGDGAPEGHDHTNVVVEMTTSEDGLSVDESSARTVLSIDHPAPNHNGGQVLFGPDGYLYVTIGDGGGANDEGAGHNAASGNGQDTGVLFGKVLRLDVEAGDDVAYRIPEDNPFVDGGGLPEIFAYGFRNPAYAAFDPETGGLFVADAGQARYEEVNIVVKGGNYGWRVREGAHCFDPDDPRGDPTGCPERDARGEEFKDPIGEFKNSAIPGGEGATVIGGAPYHGTIDSLEGGYVFGAFRSG